MELLCVAESDSAEYVHVEWILPRDRHYKVPQDKDGVLVSIFGCQIQSKTVDGAGEFS